MRHVKDIGIVLVLSLTCALLFQANVLLRDVRLGYPAHIKKLDAAFDGVQGIETDTQRTVQIAGGALNTVRDIARDEQKAEKDQLAQVKQVTDASLVVLGDTHRSIQQLGDAAQSIGNIAPSAKEAIQSFSMSSQDVLRTLNVQLDDPAIAQSLEFLNESAQHIASTTDQASGIATDLHHETSVLVTQTDKALAPKTRAEIVKESLPGVLEKLLEIAYYIKNL